MAKPQKVVIVVRNTDGSAVAVAAAAKAAATKAGLKITGIKSVTRIKRS